MTNVTELDVYKPPFEQLNQRRLSELEALCLAPMGPHGWPAIRMLESSTGIGLNRQSRSFSENDRRIAHEATRQESRSWELLTQLYDSTEPDELQYLLHADMHGWAMMRVQSGYYPNRTDTGDFEVDRRYVRDALLGEPLYGNDPEYPLFIEHIVDARGTQSEAVAERFQTGMKRELQVVGAALLMDPFRHHGQLLGLKEELNLSDNEIQTVFTLAMGLASDHLMGFYDIALSDEALQKAILESDKPELQGLVDGDLVVEYSLAAYLELVDKGSAFGTLNWDRLVAYHGEEGMEMILPVAVRAEIVNEIFSGRVEKLGRIVEPHFHADVLQVLDTNLVAQRLSIELDKMIAEPWAHLEKSWPSEFEYSFWADRIEKQYGIDLNLQDLRLHDTHIQYGLEALQKFALPDSELAEKARLLKERADSYDPALLKHIESYCATAAKRCFEYADPIYSKRTMWYEEDQPWVDQQVAEAEGQKASLDALVVMMKLRLKELGVQS